MLIALLAVGSLLSCRGEIIHEYECDLTPLAALTTPLHVDLWHLARDTRVFAKEGMNTSSKQAQPDGIVDWVEVDVPTPAAHRSVTANIRAFDTVEAAKRHIGWELEGWRPSRPDKYRRGVLPNGVEYSASYIVQHRADPEGCNAPMESYGAFLVFRSDRYVITVDVSEDRPRGVTAEDTSYVVGLLNRPHADAAP